MTKRIFDIVVTLMMGFFLFPIALVVSIMILLECGGGVFFKQERIGQFGKPFYLWKFRTMKKDAESKGQLTIGMKDDRITKLGTFLRKYKLDEIPQLINVLIGEMSLVGPRPEVKKYVNLYTEEQRKILNAKPGITDYASLEYFKENEILGNAKDPEKAYIEEIMPHKLRINQKFLRSSGLAQDINVLYLTALRILGLYKR
jgi:lipopolysaccharide/colanic/teichoic acid biosynthesis glycosyltransferase